MRTLPLLPLFFLLLAAPAYADGIALYADSYGGMCAKPSLPFSINTVYVFHEATAGAMGSSWRIENTSGMQGLGSSCGQLGITGDVWTGISVAYGSCLSGTFLICQVELFNLAAGGIPDCYQLRVVGYPGYATPTVVDCNQTESAASGGYFTFDIEGKINCDDCATPVESKTWGAVKSLYR